MDKIIELPEDLVPLFRACDCGGTNVNCTARYLIGTDYMYTPGYGWYAPADESIPFEEVLDNCPEEIQTQLLFHLDYFTGEIDE